ncbi:hypothetical protein N7501_006682 [Penicillium viridicatum]|nr:hypothetical protein N7501_006682 [Penicillium viridicatum]
MANRLRIWQFHDWAVRQKTKTFSENLPNLKACTTSASDALGRGGSLMD